MRDEARAHHLADERCQVGRHVSHLGDEVGVQRAAVVDEGNHSLGEALDIEQVNGGDILAWDGNEVK